MPRPPSGPRLYFDRIRQQWVIREGRKFVRTGTDDRKGAELKFAHYLGTRAYENTPPPPLRFGTIYFISSDDGSFPIKIGFTEKLAHIRLRDIQIGCPYKLKVLAHFRGTYADENYLHRNFASSRLEGEWFARTELLMELIRGRQKNAA